MAKKSNNQDYQLAKAEANGVIMSELNYVQQTMVSKEKYDQLKQLVGEVIDYLNTPVKCYGKLADLEKKYKQL